MVSNKTVPRLIRNGMNARGWQWKEIENLPGCHVGDGEVTPYFYCFGAKLRPFGDFIVEGTIGVIHKRFEQKWNRSSVGNQFACALLLSNFPTLQEVMYVPNNERIQFHVERFCEAVHALLSAMPNDEEQLVAASIANSVAGAPFDAFANVSQRIKFREFRRFVDQLRPETSKK